MPKMNIKTKKLKLLLFGSIIASVCIVGILLVGLIFPNNNSASASILDNQVFVDSTEEYINEDLGFKIRYYPNWLIARTEKKVIFYTKFEEFSDLYVENLSVTVYDSFNIDEYKKTLDVRFTDVMQIEDFEVDRIYSNSIFGNSQLESISYIFDNSSKVYVLQYTGQIGGGYDKYLVPTQEMVQSFITI